MSLQSLASVHRVKIERQAVARGSQAGAKLTWPTVRDRSVPCRVEPLSSTKRLEHIGLTGLTVTHRVYFTSDVALTVQDRLVFGAREFEVRGYHNTDELGRLFVADVDERFRGQASYPEST